MSAFEELAENAKAYGINASMYNLLPPNKREAALRKDIERAREREAKVNGQNRQTQIN